MIKNIESEKEVEEPEEGSFLWWFLKEPGSDCKKITEGANESNMTDIHQGWSKPEGTDKVHGFEGMERSDKSQEKQREKEEERDKAKERKEGKVVRTEKVMKLLEAMDNEFNAAYEFSRKTRNVHSTLKKSLREGHRLKRQFKVALRKVLEEKNTEAGQEDSHDKQLQTEPVKNKDCAIQTEDKDQTKENGINAERVAKFKIILNMLV